MADVVRSIFRQKQIEVIYKIDEYKYGYSYGSEYYTVIMMPDRDPHVICDQEIGRYDVEIPLLEVGDSFFLHDIQKEVKIKSRMRSSDGSITYYVDDEVVETENSKKTKEECEKAIKEFEEFKKEFDNYRKEYKYKNRFFNKKV